MAQHHPTNNDVLNSSNHNGLSAIEHPNIVQQQQQPPGGSVPIFLRNTHDMICYCDRTNPTIACWGNNGTRIIIKDAEAMTRLIFPSYFKHKNFLSFTRQLNFYGFRKIKSKGRCVYHHDYFQNNRPDLLSLIHRHSNDRDQEQAPIIGTQRFPAVITNVNEVNELKHKMDSLTTTVATLQEEVVTLKTLVTSLMECINQQRQASPEMRLPVNTYDQSQCNPHHLPATFATTTNSYQEQNITSTRLAASNNSYQEQNIASARLATSNNSYQEHNITPAMLATTTNSYQEQNITSVGHAASIKSYQEHNITPAMHATSNNSYQELNNTPNHVHALSKNNVTYVEQKVAPEQEIFGSVDNAIQMQRNDSPVAAKRPRLSIDDSYAYAVVDTQGNRTKSPPAASHKTVHDDYDDHHPIDHQPMDHWDAHTTNAVDVSQRKDDRVKGGDSVADAASSDPWDPSCVNGEYDLFEDVAWFHFIEEDVSHKTEDPTTAPQA